MGGEVYLKDLDDLPRSSRSNKFNLNKLLTDSEFNEIMKFNSDNDIDKSEVDFKISTDESICNDDI